MDGSIVVTMAGVAIVVFAPFWYSLAGADSTMKVVTFVICLTIPAVALFFWVAAPILWFVAWGFAFVANGPRTTAPSDPQN